MGVCQHTTLRGVLRVARQRELAFRSTPNTQSPFLDYILTPTLPCAQAAHLQNRTYVVVPATFQTRGINAWQKNPKQLAFRQSNNLSGTAKVMPYLLILLVDLVVLTYVPSIITFLPNMLR